MTITREQKQHQRKLKMLEIERKKANQKRLERLREERKQARRQAKLELKARKEQAALKTPKEELKSTEDTKPSRRRAKSVPREEVERRGRREEAPATHIDKEEKKQVFKKKQVENGPEHPEVPA